MEEEIAAFAASCTEKMPEHSVTFGAMDLKVHKASAALETLVGPLPEGFPLLDVLGGYQLRRAVQQSINELCYPTAETPDKVTLQQVLLKPSRKSATAAAWTVTCTLDFTGLEEDSVELDNLIVQAVLTNVVAQEPGATQRKLVAWGGKK